MDIYRFLLSGSGGQGIISSAILLADAGLHEGHNAVQLQSYGPEARGGATRSDVIISDGTIYYPKVEQPNYLVALTNQAMGKYLPLLRPGGLFLYDCDLVQPDLKVDAVRKGLPMFRTIKEKMGTTIAYNICVLGALIQLTAVVALASVEPVLAERFGAKYHENNKNALQLGAEIAKPFMDA
ncbi:MAG: 2-oxoacid:acceptor oxidoreductase family protein [Deltaproteobacteria bacterium]|jgi:2-oxoglutarate ferredoxin oxidoreductase subunit gamma|nr:2-oxoacid:acceptor oxidoreductase family protein [Deltaproteobacteria bacterium]